MKDVTILNLKTGETEVVDADVILSSELGPDEVVADFMTTEQWIMHYRKMLGVIKPQPIKKPITYIHVTDPYRVPIIQQCKLRNRPYTVFNNKYEVIERG